MDPLTEAVHLPCNARSIPLWRSVVCALGILVLSGHESALAKTSGIPVGELRGVINPVAVSYVDRLITEAEDSGAPLVVLSLDTPGGLETSMRDITQRILRSRIPVVVFVSPPGARAASAGVFITYAAHVAAMAPQTNIGSAHPVMEGGGGSPPAESIMMEKVTNDAVALIRGLAEARGRNGEWAEQAIRESVNLTASDALRINVVDLVALDVADLLQSIEGRTVRVDGREWRIASRGLEVELVPMNPIERLLHVISDPTVAYLLLSLGGLALIYELSNPGAILPGVVGGIALLLALYSLGTLPVNVAGIGLILFALLLLLADIMIGGSGFLTVGGIASFALGSALLAIAPDTQAFMRVSVPVAGAMTLAFTAFFGFVAVLILSGRRKPTHTGTAALLGELGTTRTRVGRTGTVFVAGEFWQASAEEPQNPIPEGRRVKVISANGLRLTVRPEET
ncbi:MAG: serine protease [Chloroflexi bacterium]|nr:serine protease [Chloroflexota bacterium]